MENRQIKRIDFTPRGLSRTGAAYYIGVGTSKFDEMVRDGRMPAPKMIDSRVIWDRWEIDLAFDALPYRDDQTPKNIWDEII
ncbi:XRE family transcriptional regulator [Brucella sp. RRSP16]|uniref:XRE family transcriptional regulator n=1 Tax=Brucella sp. RRSP16 TaxID=3453707 RepID=UPI003FCDFFF4